MKRVMEGIGSLGVVARVTVIPRNSGFDFETALVWRDRRRDYGEIRYVAIGWIDERLHVVCFTETDEGIRVISLRKANDREAERYGGT